MSDAEGPVLLRGYGITDPGLKRAANEDAFVVSEAQGLFLVTDGMGGAPAGALASAMVAQALPLQVAAGRLAQGTAGSVDVAGLLVGAIGIVNDLLNEKTRDAPQAKGMGATLDVCLVAGPGTLAVAHLGDSRVYLLRRGVLERLTEDHTVANLLLQTGHIGRREFRDHPSRHVLTRHIGMENCPSADAALLRLCNGDRLLLCTDGLTGMLDDQELGTILLESPEREEACRRLIARANEAGGRDNVTAVVVDAGEATARHGQRRRKVRVRRQIGRSLERPQAQAKKPDDATMEL